MNGQKFYHGIGAKLRLPKYIDDSNKFIGLLIHCPLSTTSSWEVGVQFANNNQGLIIEFGDNDNNEHSPRYFSVDWLSDYSNEKEYIFIQNNDWTQGLKINNITDAESAIDFKSILNALQTINKILDEGYIDNITNYDLVIKILKHQLSLKLPEYEEMKDFHWYARQMCDTYFTGKKTIKVDYINAIQYNESILEILIHSKCEWVNNQIINALLPNITDVQMNEINLCEPIIEQILRDIQTKSTESKLQQIEIIASGQRSEKSVQDVIEKYTARFRENNVFIYGKLEYNRLHVDWSEPLEFASFLIKNIENDIYIQDLKGEITILLNQALTNNNSKNEANDYCLNKEKVKFNFKNMKQNKDSYLFNKFYRPQYGWIKLKQMNLLFPRIKHIHIKNINLTTYILQNILQHLRHAKTKIKEIRIRNLHKNGLSISQAVSQYEDDFNAIHFDLIKEPIDINTDIDEEKEGTKDDSYNTGSMCLLIKKTDQYNDDEQNDDDDSIQPMIEIRDVSDSELDEDIEEEKLSEEENENDTIETQSDQKEDSLMEEIRNKLTDIQQKLDNISLEQKELRNLVCTLDKKQQQTEKTMVDENEINNLNMDEFENTQKNDHFDDSMDNDKYVQLDDTYYYLLLIILALFGYILQFN
eukprot:525276_1